MFIVTGANGFIGSALVWELNQAGYADLICTDSVDLNSRPSPLANLQYQKFYSPQQLMTKLNDANFCREIKCIFHMGACSDTTEMDVEFLKKNNTEYTNDLFSVCTQHGIDFIYASSGAVYGNGSQGFDDRTDPRSFTPLNPYGQSKLASDIWALQQEKTPPRWYGLRFFNVYGPSEYHKKDMRSLVHKAFEQINSTGQLELFRSHNPNYEDGKQMRDFIYVKDITRWIVEFYTKQGIESGIYNLGTGTARTWLELASSVFSNMNKELRIKWIDIPDYLRNQYQYYTRADITKLESQKMSSPQWPIEKGITDYLQNFLLTDDPYFRG